MKLQDLMVDTKAVWLDFPGCAGFQVQIANLSRKELVALRKKCLSQKFDRKTRTVDEILDEEKFVREFTKATVKGWSGLKLRYLEQLMLVDLKGNDLDDEVEYDQEQAELLVQNSTEFDNWLNEVVFDLSNFRSGSD